MTCGIYRIYNKVNGKSYIGQSIDVERRIYVHFRSLNRDVHPNDYLQSAFKLHGREAFEWQLLETCEKADLTEKEQFWIDTALYHAGVYNLAKAATSRRGVKASEATREKIRLARKEQRRGPASENVKAAIIASNKHRAGQKLSEEHRKKISEGGKGVKKDERARQNISAGLKGKPKSEEHRRNMSEAAKERWRKRNEESAVDRPVA